MAFNLIDYIETLKGFKATPDEELFDQIFEQIRKPKKKKRPFFWLLLVPVIGISAFFFIPQGSVFFMSDQVQNVTKEQTSSNVSIDKQKVNTEQNEDTQSIDKELGNVLVKTNTENQRSIKKDIVNSEMDEVNFTLSNTESNENTIIKIEKETIKKTKSIIESNNVTLHKSNGELVSIASQNNKKSIHQKDKINQFFIETKVVNSENNVSLIDKPNSTIVGSSITSSSRTFSTVPLLLTLKFEELPIKVVDYELIDTRLKYINSPIRNHRSFLIGAETSQYRFCDNGVASSIALNADIILPITEKLSLNIGLAHQLLKYDLSFDDKMLRTFGNTDKYPAMYFLKDRILTIKNNMQYQTLKMGINYHLFSLSKIDFEIGFSQDLIIHSKQYISYKLQKGKTFHYQKSSFPFSLGLSRTNLKVFYPLSRGIEIYTQASYGYSFQFVGIEKEKYSGLIIGIGMKFRI